jgi:hypothetical protein
LHPAQRHYRLHFGFGSVHSAAGALISLHPTDFRFPPRASRAIYIWSGDISCQ